MASSEDIQKIGTGLKTGGMIAGGAIGGYMGGPAGAMAGASAGTAAGGAIQSILDLTIGPDIVATGGPTGAQASLAAMSMEQAERANELRGLTQQQFSRLRESQLESTKEQLQMINLQTMASMSPLEKEVLGESVIRNIQKAETSIGQATTRLDIAATSANMTKALQATRQATIQQENMRVLKEQQRQKQQDIDMQRYSNFVTNISTMMSAISSAGEVISKQQELDAAAILAKQGATDSETVEAKPVIHDGQKDVDTVLEKVNAVDNQRLSDEYRLVEQFGLA